MAVVSYKCPNCDGGLVFDPKSQMFTCEYCNSSFSETVLRDLNPDRQSDKAVENPQPISDNAEEAAPERPTHTMMYSCPSCGAEVVTDDTTAATFCYFCHNPVVLEAKLVGDFAPDLIVPFAIDRQAAEKSFMDWIGTKKFVPHSFHSKDQIEKLTGVYFPYWMVDVDLSGTLNGTATKVRTWRTGQTQYTETSHFRVDRGGSFRLPGITRNALRDKISAKLVEGVLPFQMDKLRPFQMSYLSGFQAEKRNIERAGAEQEVNSEAYSYTRKLLYDSVSGYSTVAPGNVNIDITDARWRYALLPVWVLTYRHGSTTYYYAMNGQTGKVCGVLPVDRKKLAGLFAAIAVPLSALLLIGGWFI